MNPVLIKPHISEKAIALADKGVYTFQVPTKTNKIEVAKQVESTFKVNVIDVNMLIQKGKKVSKRYGKQAGSRSDLKKAILTLKKGQTIALFEEGGK